MIEESPRFESFRAPRSDDRWKDCHAALYDRQLGKFIAGAYAHRLELVTENTRFFGDRRLQLLPFKGRPYVITPIDLLYEYWLFSSDKNFEHPGWIFEVRPPGKEIPLLFTPKFPYVKLSVLDARVIGLDHVGNPLAERVEVWKDSDSRRGALSQFHIEGPDPELSMIAVLTLFVHSVYRPPLFA